MAERLRCKWEPIAKVSRGTRSITESNCVEISPLENSLEYRCEKVCLHYFHSPLSTTGHSFAKLIISPPRVKAKGELIWIRRLVVTQMLGVHRDFCLCTPPPLELLILSCELCFLNMQEQGKKVAYLSMPFNTGVIFSWF